MRARQLPGAGPPASSRSRPAGKAASPSPRKPRRWSRRRCPGPRPEWYRPTSGWWPVSTPARPRGRLSARTPGPARDNRGRAGFPAPALRPSRAPPPRARAAKTARSRKHRPCPPEPSRTATPSAPRLRCPEAPTDSPAFPFSLSRRRGMSGAADASGRSACCRPWPGRSGTGSRRTSPHAVDSPYANNRRPGHRCLAHLVATHGHASGLVSAAQACQMHKQLRQARLSMCTVRAATRGRLARLLRSAGAPRLQPRARHRGNRSRVGRVGRAVARHLAADTQGPRDHPQHHRQGRTVAGGRAARDHRARAVDSGDLRGMGRSRRPDGGRRLRAAPRPPARPRRETGRPAHQGPHAHGHPDVLPRLPGMGMVPPPLRPHPGAGPAAQRRRADRHRPPRHRRRRMGQAPARRAEHRGRRPAGHLSRQLLPDGTHPRAYSDLAVLRPAQRRDLPATDRLHPLAARRAAHPG